MNSFSFHYFLTHPVHAIEYAKDPFLRINVAGKKADDAKKKNIKDNKVFNQKKLIRKIKYDWGLRARRHQHE